MRKKLKKNLKMLDVFSIASGAMISSGIFILPAIIYRIAGPSIILSYFFASILVIPALFSKMELATAMPKAGGTYFFIHRSFGVLFGTFAGLASWISISLKSAFALVGMGIFISPLLPFYGESVIKILAVAFTLFFGRLNIKGAKKSALFQNWLVIALLIILTFYILAGFENIDITRYVPFREHGWIPVFSATGMIFVSFGGLTKVASIAEEVRNPSQVLPGGMIAAYVVVTAIYIFAVFVTIGLLDKQVMLQSLTPLSQGAFELIGEFGYLLLATAGMLAFITTANAGILSASRVPLAMSDDELIPGWFSQVHHKHGSPTRSIIFTAGFMILVILLLDLENLVKVASTMMLILFTLVNISVILMRESRIISYRPHLKSFGYPYLQIGGSILYVILIIEMGMVPLLLTFGFFMFSLLWFVIYSKSRNIRKSALLHIVERVTSNKIKTSTLSHELRQILRERDSIEEDRFDKIIKHAEIIDIDDEINMKELIHVIARTLSNRLAYDEDNMFDHLLKRELETTTMVNRNLAIPHIVIEGNNLFDIVILRTKKGIKIDEDTLPIHIVFALAGTLDERTFHLQSLMAIAQIIHKRSFTDNWMKPLSIDELRNLILVTHRRRDH